MPSKLEEILISYVLKMPKKNLLFEFYMIIWCFFLYDALNLSMFLEPFSFKRIKHKKRSHYALVLSIFTRIPFM